MIRDQELLERYARQHSQDAFTILVSRHLNLVYSAALRQVRSQQLAEEVSQSVFADLARNADKLKSDTLLTAWLYQITRRTAIDVIRQESRRQMREQIATQLNAMNAPQNDWEQVESLLDEAMSALDDPDRTAVLLRFFENKSLRDVGQQLGVSDDAAQKRVARAVERLREFFSKREVAVGTGGLALLISANAVQSAPIGLVASISNVAIAGTSTAAAIAITKTIAMTTLQKTFIIATVAALAGTGIYEKHQNSKLSEENAKLQKALNDQPQLLTEHARLSKVITQANQSNSELSPEQFRELLRLRDEVGRLRQPVQISLPVKLTPTQSSAARLRQQLEEMPNRSIPELQFLDEQKWAEDADKGELDTEEGVRKALGNLRRAAKIKFGIKMGQALNAYTKMNNGQLPEDATALSRYFTEPVDETLLHRYELLHTGSTQNLPPDEAVIGEKAPVDDQFDTLLTIGTGSFMIRGTGKWSQIALTNTWTPGR